MASLTVCVTCKADDEFGMEIKKRYLESRKQKDWMLSGLSKQSTLHIEIETAIQPDPQEGKRSLRDMPTHLLHPEFQSFEVYRGAL